MLNGLNTHHECNPVDNPAGSMLSVARRPPAGGGDDVRRDRAGSRRAAETVSGETRAASCRGVVPAFPTFRTVRGAPAYTAVRVFALFENEMRCDPCTS